MSETRIDDPSETDRAVVITWPRSKPGAPVLTTGVQVHDAETGTQITDGVRLTLDLGSEDGWEIGPIETEITRIVGDDDQPGAISYTPEYRAHLEAGSEDRFDGKICRTRTFHYTVAAMRIAPPFPLADTPLGRRGCGCMHFLDEDGHGTSHECPQHAPHREADDAHV